MTLRIRVLVPAIAVVSIACLVASGCSSGSSTGGVGDGGPEGSFTTSEAGSGDGGSIDSPSGDAGGECTSLVNSAPEVQSTGVAGTLPTPMGGSPLADGTYYLTSETVYGSTASGGGTTHQETMLVSGGTMEIIKLGSTNAVDRSRWTFTASGTTLTRTRTCPSAKTEVLGYDATPTTFALYATDASTARTYARQ